MNLREAINKARIQFGEDIIFQPRLVSIIDDFGAFQYSSAPRFIIRELIRSNQLREFLHSNLDNQERIIQKVTHMYGFDVQLVRDVFSAFNASKKDSSYTAKSNEMSQYVNNSSIKTDIIFIIDACNQNSKCRESISYFIQEIASELGENVNYRIFHYNDISLWDVKEPTNNRILKLPYIDYVGNNNFEQALLALCDAPINWKQQTNCPVLIWLVGSNPANKYSELLDKLSHQDILFNKAFRYTITFGNSVSRNIVSAFSNQGCFSSIDIDEAIDAIRNSLNQRLISVEAFLDDEDVLLLQKKIKQQLEVKQSPEILITKKSESFKEGFFACKRNGKWGWVGINGQQAIPFQYETVMAFSEGLAAVSSKGTPKGHTYGMRFYIPAKWGFINFLGQQVIEEKYDDVKNFSHGIAFVEIDGKWGAIDKSGKIIIPLEFYSIIYVSDSIIRVTKRTYNTSTNNYIEKCGYFSVTGKQVSDIAYDFASYEFPNNRGLVKTGDKTYLINANGRRISTIPYFSVQFTNHKSLLLISRGKFLYGLCTLDGIEIIPPKYEKILIDENALIFAKSKDFVDYYTEDGSRINKFELLSGFRFVEGVAIVKKMDGKWYKMNSIGEFYKLTHSEIYYVFENGNMLIKHYDSRYPNLRFCALIEADGKVIKTYHLFNNDLNRNYSESSEYVEFEEIEIDSNKGSTKLYWFNKHNGLQIFSGNKYNESHNFRIHNGYLVISKYYEESYVPTFRNGEICFNGDKIPACTKYRLRDFNTGRWIGTTNNQDGRPRVIEFDGLGTMEENRIPVKKFNKWGYLDSTGEIVIEPIYDSVEQFHNGYAIVCKNNLYGIIDVTGKCIVDIQYQQISLIQKEIYGEM